MEERITEVGVRPIAVITINRPKDAQCARHTDAVGAGKRLRPGSSATDDVRVIIITGAGERAFVAGGDIADLEFARRACALSRIRRDRAPRVPPHRDLRQADHRGGERLGARRRHRAHARNRHPYPRRHRAARFAGDHARAVSRRRWHPTHHPSGAALSRQGAHVHRRADFRRRGASPSGLPTRSCRPRACWRGTAPSPQKIAAKSPLVLQAAQAHACSTAPTCRFRPRSPTSRA